MRFVLALAIAIGIAAPARADTNDTSRGTDKGTFGIGIILGEPTGITAKLYLQDDQAVQAAVGSALISGGFSAHGARLARAEPPDVVAQRGCSPGRRHQRAELRAACWPGRTPPRSEPDTGVVAG